MDVHHEKRNGKDRRHSLLATLDRRQSSNHWQETLRSGTMINFGTADQKVPAPDSIGIYWGVNEKVPPVE